MRFEAKARDCNTRVGEMEIGGKKVAVPNILWYSSSRIPSPPFAELKLRRDIREGGTFFYPKKCEFCVPPALIYPHFFPDKLHEKAFELSEKFFNDVFSIVSPKWPARKAFINILANSRELFSNPRNFVNAVVNVRQKIGYSLLYVPAIANPVNLAILCYAGIDLFDSIDVVTKTRKGIYFTPEGEYNLEDMNEYPCSCKFCEKGIDSYKDLLMHNYITMKNELIKVRKAIEKGMLREYVEAKTHFDTKFASILRIFDMEYYEYQEKRYALTGNKILASPYSLNRPDIKRFRERVIERYEKPDCTKLLLLLPCSAKKPYSASKSHKLFNRVISTCVNRNTIHEVIVTSPLGIVPRELEYTYPAAHYDISVIGYWDKEEIEMINDALKNYISRNKYDVIINHLPPEISELLDIDAINTCVDHPTSEESLKKLEKEIKVAEDFDRIRHTERRRDNIKAILKYQFGDAANEFLKGCETKGKFPEYKIYHNDKQLASFSPKRGLFALTFPGGQKLGRNYWVEIDDFVPKGSVFAVGVKDADERIRVGDEVVILYKDEVRGVGVARMNAEEMIESGTGEAVKIRHYK